MNSLPILSRLLFYRCLCLVVALALILAACTPPTAPGATNAAGTADQPVTITYWNGFTASDRPVMEENVAKFDETFPNIIVKMDIQPWDTIFQKLLPSLKSGGEPDIVSLGGDVLPQYATAGVLQPVDDLWNGGGLDPKNFPDGVIKGMTVDGHIYGAPIIYFTTLMYRNRDLFTAAGLEDKCPEKWADWQDAIVKLTKDENGDGKPEQYGFAWGDHAAVSMWPAIVWGGGGDFVTPDGKKSMLDDPKTIAAIQEWTDLIKDKQILALGLSGVEADNLFQTGKAAMEIVGPWVSTGFKDAGINFEICQIPEGPSGRFTQGSGVYMTINKNSQHKEAAYELLKFWQDEWAQVNWSSKTGFPPTQPAFASNETIQQNPYVQAFADSAPYARTYLPGVVQFSKVDADIITPAILSIARGEKSAEEALTAAAAAMNEVLAEQ